MTIHKIKEKFMEKRSYMIDDESQLLDFAKQAYIQNEISANEFRSAVKELELRGAQNLDFTFRDMEKVKA